jgi:HTH-type transcriptional regulator/antitoxin HigA
MYIQPIKNEKDYDDALAKVEKLWGADEGTENGDKLDILLVLVDDYENKHYPISPPDPIEAIKFRMDQMNLTRKDLEPYIGSRGRISEIFNQRRELSLNMIRNLHYNLCIPLESLIGNVNKGLTKTCTGRKSLAEKSLSQAFSTSNVGVSPKVAHHA